MTKITLADVQAAGYCVTGIFRWFREHGFTNAEFSEFLENGIDRDELISRGDFLAERVVRMADKRKGRTVVMSDGTTEGHPEGGCPTKTCPGEWA